MSGVTPRGPILGDTPSGGEGGALLPGGTGGSISTGGSPLSLPAAKSTSTAKQNVTSVSNPTDTTPQEGQPLWMRKWKLSIGPNTGGTNQAYDLSQFAFEFDITLQQFKTGNGGKVTVYNMDPTLLAKVNSKDITNLSLEAGYSKPSNQYGPVIRGQIVFYRAGKRSATDTFVEFFVQPWDQAINATVVNQWLPAGYVKSDVINAALQVMAPYGVTLGQIPDLGNDKSPRGRLLFGMARDILRDVANTADAQWFIDQSGKLHMLKQAELLAMGNQSVPILNSKTGMVDVPILTPGSGIEVHCLLNPQIKPGEQVQVNEADLVQTVAVSQDNPYFGDQVTMMKTARRTTDGHYTVQKVRHFGQNRGNPWYSHVTTVNAYGQGVPSRPATTILGT
jgi:hypothetical protein